MKAMRPTKKHVWITLAAVKLGVLAIIACSVETPASSPGVDAGASSSPPTYYADVKPIVDEKCAICHYEGGIAPFTLLTYQDLAAHADAIGPAVQSQTMPPWPPASGCNTYRGDRALSRAEITTITSWAAGPLTEGDPSTYKPLGDPPPPSLSRIDDQLQMPSAFTPDETPDDYRCFLLPWPETTTKYITGFGAKPGQATIVHHLLAYIVPPAQIATYQGFDDAEPGPGYTCFGGPFGNSNVDEDAATGSAAMSASQLPQMVGGWVPGASGADFAEGTGIQIQPGSMIVLQVHYNTLSAPPVPDQTTLDFEVADSVAKEAYILPLTNPSWPKDHTMNIAAGDPDAGYGYEVPLGVWASYLTNGAVGNAPFTVYSSLLHMHLHGVQASMGIDHEDGGTSCLLDIPKWNFHWQGTYAFTTPMQVDPSDQIEINCQWDNSAANQPVINGSPLAVGTLNWGEKTTDEMCLGFVYVTQ